MAACGRRRAFMMKYEHWACLDHSAMIQNAARFVSRGMHSRRNLRSSAGRWCWSLLSARLRPGGGSRRELVTGHAR